MNHRLARVKELIRRELGTIFERSYRFEGSLVTIHDLDLTPDLKQCFVYVGILGNGAPRDQIIKKLNEGRSQIQRDLFKRVILKNSPTLSFRIDESIERGVRVLHAIETLPEPPADYGPNLIEDKPKRSPFDEDDDLDEEENFEDEDEEDFEDEDEADDDAKASK
jgi:ribosome-binding factor A